jgi:hypothetical protein
MENDLFLLQIFLDDFRQNNHAGQYFFKDSSFEKEIYLSILPSLEPYCILIPSAGKEKSLLYKGIQIIGLKISQAQIQKIDNLIPIVIDRSEFQQLIELGLSHQQISELNQDQKKHILGFKQIKEQRPRWNLICHYLREITEKKKD